VVVEAVSYVDGGNTSFDGAFPVPDGPLSATLRLEADPKHHVDLRYIHNNH